jgi:type I restriction enzyme S subunit
MQIRDSDNYAPRKNGICMELTEAKKAKLQSTELGKIPKDWIASTFGETFTGFSSGMTPYRGIPEYYKGNIPWITSGELNYNIIEDTWEKITEDAVLKTNLKIHPVGTFLMAITGLEAAGTRGSCAITGIKATTNQSCMALFPIKGKTITEYLYHFYVHYGNELAFKYCQGTKQQSYTGRIAKRLPINLPPTLSEQRAVATVLSDTDALIQALEKKIAKKKLIKKGVMQELLRPKEGWETVPFNQIFTFYSTSNYSKAQMSEDGEVGCMHYGLIHAISNTHYNLSGGIKYYVSSEQAKYEFIRDGDVIMVDASEDLEGINKSVEVSGIKGNKYIAGLHTYLIRDDYSVLADRFRGIVLNSQFVKNQMLKLAVGMKVFGVSKTQMSSIKIPIPKKIAEQKAIAQTLTDMDIEIEALEQKLAKYQLAKQGMMQQLLTGKIRLV